MRFRTPHAWGLAALVVSAAGAAGVLAMPAQVSESGPKLGAVVDAFDVYDVTGPNQGTELCYRWRYGASPVVCIFTRTTSGPLTGLVKAVDEKIAENPKLKAFVVRLTDTDHEAEVVKALRDLAAHQGIEQVPLTLVEDPAGPASYQIAEDAEVTVLLWRQAELEAKHAFAAGELDEEGIQRVLADLPKILDE